jgi:hypothetical protein
LRDSPLTIPEGKDFFNPAGCARPLRQLSNDLKIGQGLASSENFFPKGHYFLGKTPESLVERVAQKSLDRHIMDFSYASIQSFIAETSITYDDTDLGVIQY